MPNSCAVSGIACNTWKVEKGGNVMRDFELDPAESRAMWEFFRALRDFTKQKETKR